MRDLGKLAIIGSANLDIFGAHLLAVAGEHDLTIETVVPEFGTARMELLKPADQSAVQQALSDGPAATLIFERAEDVLGEALRRPVPVDDAALEAAMAPLEQVIRSARKVLPGPVLVASLTAFEPPALGLADAAAENGAAALIARANARLAELVQDLPDLLLLDCGEMLAEVGRTAAAPGEFWHMARVPFSETFGRHLARKALGALLALRGMTARLIVLDMDNTLWGGVIGEDGLGGIEIGGAYPGAAYRAFHDALKALSDRGVALAVASKNDEEVALAALTDHPEMGLRPADLVAHRINWQEKAGNIAAMLDELNLGTASCLFIDDNPVEREKVRAALPDVIVPDFPGSPDGLCRMLWNSPFLECVELTASDLKRNAQYKARASERDAKAQFEDLESFYRHLEMKLTFEPLGDGNRLRVQQLLVKTNQFNMTTRRHDAAALDRIIVEGGAVFAVGVEDRNLPYELMGVLVLRDGAQMAADYGQGQAGELWIDSFLMSCRILGRTVENAIVGWVTGFARTSGKSAVIGQVIETPRNTPARGLYADCGLAEMGQGLWRWDCAAGAAPVPDYFEVSAGADRMPEGKPAANPLATKPTANPLSLSPAANPLATTSAKNPLSTSPAPNPLATKPAANPLATGGANPLAMGGNPLAAGGNPLALGGATSGASSPELSDLAAFFRNFFKLPADADLSAATMDTVQGWDSMNHVRMMMALETALGQSLPPEEMFSVRSFADLQSVAQRYSQS